MALIQWNETLSVSIAEIDRQHQKLVGMINDLNDEMRKGRGKEILGKIVNELIGYSVTHFKMEEKYFDQFGYPDTENHKAAHADFIQKVTEFKNDFSTGKKGLTIEIMDFLSDWLQKHIKGTDKKYVPFLQEKGLK
jgi:hemerythrin